MTDTVQSSKKLEDTIEAIQTIFRSEMIRTFDEDMPYGPADCESPANVRVLLTTGSGRHVSSILSVYEHHDVKNNARVQLYHDLFDLVKGNNKKNLVTVKHSKNGRKVLGQFERVVSKGNRIEYKLTTYLDNDTDAKTVISGTFSAMIYKADSPVGQEAMECMTLYPNDLTVFLSCYL